jgi:protein-tyrosine phosphatase
LIRICFVCLGNICRSPTAEGVMRHLVREAELEHAIEVDSAGTAAYHAGEPPDRRSQAAARRRGIALGGRARRFEKRDFSRFDYVIAMDGDNLADLLDLAPDGHDEKVRLLRSFDPTSPADAGVPDPYYGGERGFDDVVEIVLAGCQGLLAELRRRHGL